MVKVIYDPTEVEKPSLTFRRSLYIIEDIHVVGNLDLLQFALDESMIGTWVCPEMSEKIIMYIETGFTSVGLFFTSAKDFANHLLGTLRALAAQGFKICLKLKPNESNVHLD